MNLRARRSRRPEVREQKEAAMESCLQAHSARERKPAVLVRALGMIVGEAGERRARSAEMANGAVEVLGILPAGPASRGGVERGDIIHEVDGMRVVVCSDLGRFLAVHDPALPVRVLFLRGEMLRFIALSLVRP